MNRFSPETLVADYPELPASLSGLSPTVFGDGVLWTGGPTIFTDDTGATERWRLGENVDVRGRSFADGATILLARNDSGEVFTVDVASGAVDQEITEAVELDDVVALSPSWLVSTDGRGSLSAVQLPR
jgi:hypothetical protein